MLTPTRWETVYPRVCGGSPHVQNLLNRVYPRVCGGTANCDPGQRQGCSGSIPACAGEPPQGRAAGQPFTGLSPRVRGNQRRPASQDSSWSIPACAGEPPRVCGDDGPSIPACAGDHISVLGGLSPRVRGNRTGGTPVKVFDTGLSPRVRGNRRHPQPAHRAYPVYPRVCGGTAGGTPVKVFDTGLSPRVRGNRRHPQPAHRAYPVYPRVCGGTPHRESTIPSITGSIPACAGEPPTIPPIKDW